MGKLLVIGRSAFEIVLSTPSVIPLGESFCDGRYEFRPGGRGGIAAFCARIYGQNVSICSKVGKDGNAARLRTFLYDNKVETGSLFTDPGGQTALTVYLRDDQDIYAPCRTVFYDGVSGNLTKDDIDKSVDSSFDMALLQCDFSDEVVIHAANALSSLGVAIFADMSQCDDLSLAESLGTLDTVMISDKALAKYTEISPSSLDKCLKCCIELEKNIKAKYYIVRLTGKGIFLYDTKYYCFVAPCDPPMATKAGYADVLSAVTASLYLQTSNIQGACEAALFADRIAKENPSVFIPTPDDIRKFVGKNTQGLHFTL